MFQKIRTSTVIITFLSCSFIGFGQTPEIEWEKGFGGNNDDRATSIIQDSDGNILTVGYTNSTDGDISLQHGLKDFWVVMTDEFGSFLWEKSYGGSGYDECYSVCLTNDGGFLLAGTTTSFDGDVTINQGLSDCWVIKINSTGIIQWQKTYGGSLGDGIYSIKQVSSGGFIIGASTVSNDGDVTGHHGSDNYDYWIIKINEEGSIEWEHAYGSNNNEVIYDVIEVSTGGYLIAGYTTGEGGDVIGTHGNADFWLLRIDTSGLIIWQSSLGGSEDDEAYAVIELATGCFLVGGVTYSNDGDVSIFNGFSDSWLVKLDTEGNLQWEKTFGGIDLDETRSLVISHPNEFLLITNTESNTGDVTDNYGGCDVWIVAIDSIGNLLWGKNYGGSDTDYATSIYKSLDDELLMAAYSRSSDFDVTPGYLFFNYWIVELDLCNTKYFLDLDGDSYGSEIDTFSCSIPIGYVLDSTDCDDTNAEIYLGAPEICDYLDNDCNGIIDDNHTYILTFEDADGDEFGNIFVDSLSCFIPDGFVEDNSDCDDTNLNIYPGALEILNGIDDDCNGLIDEGLTIYETIINSIKVYPNPTEDILFIEYTGYNKSTIEIINISGQILWIVDIVTSPMQIDVSIFTSGIYFLKIKTLDGSASVKFVKE